MAHLFIVTSGFGHTQEHEVFQANSFAEAQRRAEVLSRAKGYDLADIQDEIGAEVYSEQRAYELGLIEREEPWR